MLQRAAAAQRRRQLPQAGVADGVPAQAEHGEDPARDEPRQGLHRGGGVGRHLRELVARDVKIRDAGDGRGQERLGQRADALRA